MAEAAAKDQEQGENHKADAPECPVCLQTCVHPAQLPCGHVFCYLCVKGFANQNKKCALCRQEIPRDFVEQPYLLEASQLLESTETYDGGYQWFYEGRNGWWQYEERTSKELETSYKNGDKSVELLIAGFLYIIDFENMLQLRRNDPSRRRQIKRDVATIVKKGIAGIRTNSPQTISGQSDSDIAERHSSSSPMQILSNNVNVTRSPITPSNTPQSPTSGRESPNRDDDLQATVDLISNLRLDSCTGNVFDDRNNNERDEE